MDLGMIYTAMPVTNAVPYVVAAPPGIVTLADLPPITGRVRRLTGAPDHDTTAPLRRHFLHLSGIAMPIPSRGADHGHNRTTPSAFLDAGKHCNAH